MWQGDELIRQKWSRWTSATTLIKSTSGDNKQTVIKEILKHTSKNCKYVYYSKLTKKSKWITNYDGEEIKMTFEKNSWQIIVRDTELHEQHI